MFRSVRTRLSQAITAVLLSSIVVSSVWAGDADELAGLAIDAGLDQGVQALRDSGLPFLGSLQGSVVYNTSLRRIDYDVLSVYAFHGDGSGHHWLLQLGAHNLRDRQTANAGLVYRWVDPGGAWLLGANAFYDQDFDAQARRAGLGVEAMTPTLRVFANGYAPIDGWVDAFDAPDLEERPARGYDLGIAWTPQPLSILDLQLKGARWQGDAVDVFATGQTEIDPTVWSARATVRPVSALRLGFEHSRIIGGAQDFQASLTYVHQFGVPLAQQWRWNGNGGGPGNDLASRALLPVEREKRIVMDTREKDASPLFAVGALQANVYEGEAFEHAVVASGGALPLAYSLRGADAALFQLAGATLRLPAQDASAPADAGADNVYDVVVVATDAHGRTASQVVSVTVQPAGPTARNLRIEGVPTVGVPLVARYDFHSPVDEAEDVEARSFQWFRRTGSDAEEPIAGAVGDTYVPVAADIGHDIGVRVVVQSVSGRNNAKAPVIAMIDAIPDAPGHAPTATPQVTGELIVGRTVQGIVNFSDVDGDAEGEHTYQWYIAADPAGQLRFPIPGATGASHTITQHNEGGYLVFEVTPRSAMGTPATGTPTPAVSSRINSTPFINVLGVSHPDLMVGAEIVLSELNVTDADGDPVSARFVLYRADSASDTANRVVIEEGEAAVGYRYRIQAADLGKVLVLEVIPSSTQGSSPGEPSRIRVTVPAA